MGKKSKKEVVKAPVYGRPPLGTSSKCVVCEQFNLLVMAVHLISLFQVTLFTRLEIKFDPEKIGNFVTGFAKVGRPIRQLRPCSC